MDHTKKTEKIMKGKTAIREKIYSTLPSDVSDKVWEDAKSRLDKMYKEHSDLPQGVARHTDTAIFPAAAIYLSLKESAPDVAFDIMRDSMKEQSTKAGCSIAKMTSIPGFKKFFLFMWDKMSHNMFGESSGFKNVFYPNAKNEFKMDITECPYNKYLTELGCPEITKLFCDNDVYVYGNLPGLKFTRTKTIGAGDELCDFKMEIER